MIEANHRFAGWKSMSLSTKLNLAQSVVLILLMAVAVFIQSLLLFRALEERNVRHLQQINHANMDTISAFGEDMTNQAERLGGAFASYFPDHFHLEMSSAVPTLRHGERVLNGDMSDVDHFFQFTNSVATIFVLQGENFIRVATSVKKENGERAIGTRLDTDHPGRALLLRGEPYTGKATLFGRDYMTHYRPVKDESERVIGALFIGFDFTEALNNLRQRILDDRIGETGYSYVLDATGKNKGTLLIHPTAAGINLLDSKDSNGKFFVREMLENKQGLIYYDWINKERGEMVPRLKIVAYTYYDRWGWILAAGSYLDEFTSEARLVRNQSIVVVSVMVPLLLLLMFVNTRRWVARPLAEAVSLSERIANGNLTVQFSVQTGDEIGRLLDALGHMARRLRDIISHIHQAAEQLVTQARQLTETSRAVATGSEEQSSAAMSMAAALEQMTASIGTVSQHADAANQLSSQSGQVSENGVKVMHQTVDGMGKIADTVKHSSQTVEQLGKQSEEISAIVSTIKGIAEQTNLLALNAAIEAARAGEQGRGFAVVADEVKKLAERTASSTQEISGMILRIQSGTQEAVRGMETGVQLVEQGAQLAKVAGQSVGDIQESANQVVKAVSAISHALQEQNETGLEIARNVERIAQQAEKNSQRSQTAAGAATELETLALSLSDRIKLFQI
ncbi:methyl-accepting chemotaxis protein [Gammaproteobacteria bacterium]